MKWSRSLIIAGCWLVCAAGIGTALAADPATRRVEAATRPSTQPAADAPWCARVAHAPQQPKSGEIVKIGASIGPGVTGVTLQYQIVEPGAYVELKDPEYAKDWQSVPMQAGGASKGRTTYTAQLPAAIQTHRRLVRYRITAKDPAGQPVSSPITPAAPATPTSPASPESPSNYAYFVYDGLPAWKGAIDPNSNDPKLSKPLVFPPDVLARVQPYHLIGKKTSIENATWKEQPGGKEYKYTGTLVVDGIVHDHVRFRARGGTWRYALGKNMWKVDLPAGDHLRARDDFGRPYPVAWGKLNLRCIVQLGSYGRRGEQGMFETVGFRLFGLAGVPAPRTHWVQWRIIDEPDESPADQYRGDFWGLYLAIENEDGRFLKAHGLPDGNLFKMANGTGELNHHGEGQPADRSDLDQFMNAYNAGRDRPDDWWRENVDLPDYYSYRSIIECIHHYDVGEGKNYDYYKNPKTNQWTVIPWDLDLTWSDNMYGNGEEPFKSRLLWRPTFRLEYQNRLREIRDLLFNPEQAGALIDESVSVLSPPGATATSILEADRRKWDYHPALAIGGQAGQGQYYQASPGRDFQGMVQLMKDYVKSRGDWIDSRLLNDPKIPATPTATYTGGPDYPSDRLAFRPSEYKGQSDFAALKWRLAEITPADAPATTPPVPRIYEITPVWQSEELTKPDEVLIPKNIAKPGHTYRLRVRTKDATGRWSHWSEPVEFLAGRPK